MKGQWLSVTLFCERENWHCIIRERIIPLMRKLLVQNEIDAYFIGFHLKDRSSLRISIHSPINYPKKTARKIGRYFRRHLRVLDEEVNNLSLYADIFRGVPQNTVSYGLYELRNEEYIINIKISELIEMLADDTITDESTLTLAFYVHLCVIYAMPSMELLELLHSIYSIAVPGMTDQIEALDQTYRENQNTLSDIHNLIANCVAQAVDDTMVWRELIISIASSISSGTVSQDSGQSRGVLINIINTINSQLALNAEQLTVLSWYILQLKSSWMRSI